MLSAVARWRGYHLQVLVVFNAAFVGAAGLKRRAVYAHGNARVACWTLRAIEKAAAAPKTLLRKRRMTGFVLLKLGVTHQVPA